jgi:hypothetical protein
VAAGVVALHATDPTSVVLAVAARSTAPPVDAVEKALYEDRSLVRMLGMRRTMFVVPTDAVPVVHAGATMALVPRERRRVVQLVEEAGLTSDGAAYLHRAETAAMAELERRGSATGAELSKAVPELQAQIPIGEGRRWAGRVGVSTRVLFLLAAEGRIVRGRPRGSWMSNQHQWVPMAAWLPDGVGSMPVAEARAELARRWLAAFGPGTAADVKWWSGWTAKEVGTALAAVGAVEVDLDEGGTGFVLPGDEGRVRAPGPWVGLLPALDPTPMGWAGRGWYLGDHRAALFDRSGNIGPTVWCDGRVVGGWTQRAGGEVVWRLLDDVGAEATAAVEAAAARLQGWLGAGRVTPRFRTPLERELAG